MMGLKVIFVNSAVSYHIVHELCCNVRFSLSDMRDDNKPAKDKKEEWIPKKKSIGNTNITWFVLMHKKNKS